MPSQSRKHRGYASQRIVADYLRQHGWPHARAIGAGESGADIVEVIDIAVEVKARRGFNPKAALEQAEANAHGRLPFAVIRLDGQGPASIDDWPVVVRFGEFVRLLAEAGYGDGGKS
jgi:hypothetical protein